MLCVFPFRHLFIGFKSCGLDGERRVCFLLGYVTSFKMDQKNLHLLVIAVSILGHISGNDKQTKWHLATSCEQCVTSRHAEKSTYGAHSAS